MRRLRQRGMRFVVSIALSTVVGVSLLTGCTSTPSTDADKSPTPFSTAGRAAAAWKLSDGASPSPDSRSVKVDVHWVPCASGAAVDDPRPVVSYSDTQVTISVWGKLPSSGDADCQGNKVTTIEVPLSEPLGDRKLVPGTEPSTRWP